MTFSRQFRALGRFAAFFAGAWGLIGVAIGALTWIGSRDGGLLARLANYLVMYGAIGAISGAVTALVVARAEAGRRAEENEAQ